MSIIKVWGLGLSYKSKKDVLSNISFTVERGEVVGVVGHTGCGKSSLLQIIAKLIEPSEGSIETKGSMGIVFQFPEKQLFANTVYEEIGFGLKNFSEDKKSSNSFGATINSKKGKLDKDIISQKVEKALSLVGFDFNRVKAESPFAFSGGEKRKLAIASVICYEPEILLLDEPSSGLDSEGRSQLLELLKTLQAKGSTIIIVSHDNDFIAKICSRIIALENGKLINDSSALDYFYNEDLLERHNLAPCSISELNLKLTKRKKFHFPKTISYNELLNKLVSVLKKGDSSNE